MKKRMLVALLFSSFVRAEESASETRTGPAADATALAAKVEAAYKGLKYLEMEVDLMRGWDTPAGKGARNYRAVVTTRADRDHSLAVHEGDTLVAAVMQLEEAWLAANSRTVPSEVIAGGTPAPTEADEVGHVKYTLTRTEGQKQQEDTWFTTASEPEQETVPSVADKPFRWISEETSDEAVGCMYGTLQSPWIGKAGDPGFVSAIREGRHKGREEVLGRLCDVVVRDEQFYDESRSGFRRVDTLYIDAETHLFVKVVTEQYDLPSNRMDVWMVRTYRILNTEEKSGRETN